MALKTSLVSLWALEGLTDSHGSNTLTNNNSVTFVTAKVANGADLETDTDMSLSVADVATLDITGDMSISMWWKYESDIESTLISKFGAAGNRSWRIYKDSVGDQIEFHVSTDGTALVEVTWAHAASNATWYHYVLTYTAATHLAEMWLDGTSLGTNDVTVTSIFNSTAAFYIGSDAGSPSTTNDGIVDEVGVWSKVLNAGEVAQLYNAGAGLAYASFSDNPTIAETQATTDTNATGVGFTNSETQATTDSDNVKVGFSNTSKI